MSILVTGAAGFIGSHLCDALLAAGEQVVGVDAFIPYYPRAVKERNLRGLLAQPGFTFYERDLRVDDLAPLLVGVDTVYHLAAMGGLLLSWTNFDLYMTCNIAATQRLLEAVRQQGRVERFFYTSTSSIYGSDVTGPEETLPQPVSPYGITKLAAEHLVETYNRQYGVPSTILRYYSVYGPRQRPDMGTYIFIDHILRGLPITIWGDGQQLRANTYVSDAVRGTLLAAERFQPGRVYNLGGTEEISAVGLVALLEEIIGRRATINYGPPRPGEQSRTLADMGRARTYLGFTPQVHLRDGLRAQVAWQREL